MSMLCGPIVQASLRLASARGPGRQSSNAFSIEGAAGFTPVDSFVVAGGGPPTVQSCIRVAPGAAGCGFALSK
eukprot:11191318-Lingulodinium_polyedra.AAC.1